MSFLFSSLEGAIGVFVVAGLVILFSGIRLTRVADRLADLTGWGEAIFGGALLGASTSISGTVLSVSSAYSGHPELAVSNALGGIAAQTFFLSLADIAYRKANLEHAAASMENLVLGTLLTLLLALPLMATFGPDWTLFQVHPMSVVLFLTYIAGVKVASAARELPMWKPIQTQETRTDEPDEEKGGPSLMQMSLKFLFLVLLMGFAGYCLERSAVVITARTGLSQVTLGAFFTSITTSLPELVTTITAVRRGALTLAVGGIVGGNTFDVLFLGMSDLAYREGSIYHAVDERQAYLIALSMVLNGILILGLLKREKHGIGNIGAESALILVFYLLGMSYIGFSG